MDKGDIRVRPEFKPDQKVRVTQWKKKAITAYQTMITPCNSTNIPKSVSRYI